MIQVRNVLIAAGVAMAFLGLGLVAYSAFNAGSTPVPVASMAGDAAARPDISLDASGILAPSVSLLRPSDRADCEAIRGTDYRSEDERTWFAANCQTEPQAGGALLLSAAQPGAARLTPSAYTAAVAPLRDNYMSQVKFLVDQLASPHLSDTDWRVSTIQAVQNLRVLGIRMRELSAPTCMASAHGALSGGTQQLDAASNALAAGIQRQNAAQLAAARAGLQSGADAFNRASQQVSSTRC